MRDAEKQVALQRFRMLFAALMLVVALVTLYLTVLRESPPSTGGTPAGEAAGMEDQNATNREP